MGVADFHRPIYPDMYISRHTVSDAPRTKIVRIFHARHRGYNRNDLILEIFRQRLFHKLIDRRHYQIPSSLYDQDTHCNSRHGIKHSPVRAKCYSASDTYRSGH